MDDREPLQFPDKQNDRPVIEAPAPAVDHLRAAEDRLLGEDVPRHNGKPEKGAGSKFAALHPKHKAHLAAIEHLIAMEAEHAEAEQRLNAVHAKVQHAMERVAATEEESEAVEA